MGAKQPPTPPLPPITHLDWKLVGPLQDLDNQANRKKENERKEKQQEM